jgi:hypothetical protein
MPQEMPTPRVEEAKTPRGEAQAKTPREAEAAGTTAVGTAETQRVSRKMSLEPRPKLRQMMSLETRPKMR